MFKKKPQPKPDTLAPGEVVDVERDTPVWPPNDMTVPAVSGPLDRDALGDVISDEHAYHIRVDGARYVHVGVTPDGRWTYRIDE